MYNILFVDDEIDVLRSFERIFCDHTSEYTITCMSNPLSALRMLSSPESKIDLIVSDFRMPYMNGIELLNSVRKLKPDILRVVLSGISDDETIFEVIHKNTAMHYLLKPWSNDGLIDTIRNIFNIQKAIREVTSVCNKVIEVTQKSNSIYNEILHLFDEDGSSENILNFIYKNDILSQKLLFFINSMFLNVNYRILSEAVKFIGFTNLKSIILALSIEDSIMLFGENDYEKQMNLWNHSFITNKLYQYISQSYGYSWIFRLNPCAGILHNTGEFFINNGYINSKINFSEYADSSEFSSLSSIFNHDIIETSTTSLILKNKIHQYLGAYILSGMHPSYVAIESSLYHHTPFVKSIINKDMIYILFLAQHLAGKLVYREEALGEIANYDEVLKILNIDKINLEKNILDIKL